MKRPVRVVVGERDRLVSNHNVEQVRGRSVREVLAWLHRFAWVGLLTRLSACVRVTGVVQIHMAQWESPQLCRPSRGIPRPCGDAMCSASEPAIVLPPQVHLWCAFRG